MIDAGEVKQMLAARAEEVCAYLLPGGKRKQSEWAIGDVKNTPGESLRVHLDGPKAGLWADFQGAEKGANLLELWMAVRSCEFKQAIREAKDWLGVRDDGWRRAQGGQSSAGGQGSAGRPSPQPSSASGRGGEEWKTKFRPAKEGGRVWKWLLEERKVSAEAVRAYGIGETPDEKFVVFPYWDAQGELQMLKFRALDLNEKGKKEMFVLPAGAPKMLFGMPAVTGETGALYIVEGEMDALAMWDYGFPAVSVPFGAGAGKDLKTIGELHGKWIEHDWEWLEGFAQITLCLDMDEPGQMGTAAMVPRLGRHRCSIATLPDGHKDANDCLKAGVDPDEMLEAMANAKNPDPPALKKPSDFRALIWEQYYPTGGIEPGEELPFGIHKPFPFRFRPQEVTVWQGYTKHGKTVLLSYALTWLAWKYHVRSCIASLEIPAKKTLQNMGRQALGAQKPTDEKQFDRLLTWMDQYFFIYDHVGMVSVDDLLSVFAYAARRYGVKHFVLDSLMRLDLDEEDNQAQKVLVNKLCAFAAEFETHVHLVAHSRKPDAKHPEEKYWPHKYAVRGSAHIVDIAHNTICVWRNKQKELEALEVDEMEPGPAKVERLSLLKMTNDALILVQAQRGGNGEEPVRQLWFDPGGSWQYRDEPTMSVRRFVDGTAERGQGYASLPSPQSSPASGRGSAPDSLALADGAASVAPANDGAETDGLGL